MSSRTKISSVWIVCFLGLMTSALSEETSMSFTYLVPNAHIPGVRGLWDSPLIYADGPITLGTAGRFRRFVDENKIPSGAVVIFNSPGGLVSEALEMGRRIRAAGFDTSIGTKGSKERAACFSACTLAFLGGDRRTPGTNTLFGVHRMSATAGLTIAEALELGQIALGQIVEYVSYMGVKPEFVTILTQAGPSDITILLENRMSDLKIISSEFETEWEIKTSDEYFYVVSTTKTFNGIHKMIFACVSGVDNGSVKGMYVGMLFNLGEKEVENRQTLLTSAIVYKIVVDGKDIAIERNEISKTAYQSGPHYVGAEFI